MINTNLTKNLLHTTDNYIKSLEKWGIVSVWDMISLYPKDYEDRTNIIDTFSYINIKEKNVILVKLLTLINEKTSNNKLLTKAVFEDKNGFLAEGIWFNRKYFADKLQKFVWKKVIVSSKVKYAYWKVTFQSPEIETDLSKLWGEILPVYSDVNYIPGSWIWSKMYLLKDYFKYVKETLPDEIIKKYNFLEKSKALEKLHFPQNKDDIEIAKYRLAYEELFEINFKSISKKQENFKLSEWKSISISLGAEWIHAIQTTQFWSLCWLAAIGMLFLTFRSISRFINPKHDPEFDLTTKLFTECTAQFQIAISLGLLLSMVFSWCLIYLHSPVANAG